MNEIQKKILREMSGEKAGAALVEFVESLLGNDQKLHPPHVLACNQHAEYWLMAGVNKGYLTCLDQISAMGQKTLEVATEPETRPAPEGEEEPAAPPAPEEPPTS